MTATHYRLYRRHDIYYSENVRTRKQESLQTKDRDEAVMLVEAKTQAARQPHLNFQMARAYLTASDPAMCTRTWRMVLATIIQQKSGPTAHRWQTASKDPAFDSLRDRRLLETRAEHFLKVLRIGTVSTNVYLRRLHNFALDLSWIPWPILPRRQWSRVKYREKRAITAEEHLRIIQREKNPERKAFYQLAWHLGASQSDLANLQAQDIDWTHKIIIFRRKKTSAVAQITISGEVEKILQKRPSKGSLFPYLSTVRASDRATEFKQRCRGLGIHDITLHSYRYAWAQRAKTAGYPERFAQMALGHNSKAVHRAYAKNALVKLPALEDYERASLEWKIIPMLTASTIG